MHAGLGEEKELPRHIAAHEQLFEHELISWGAIQTELLSIPEMRGGVTTLARFYRV